jgi:hypothetical protein
VILRKFASSLQVLRVLLWLGSWVRCCERARLNRLAVDPCSSEFAVTDRGGPWSSPSLRRSHALTAGSRSTLMVAFVASSATRVELVVAGENLPPVSDELVNT